MTNDTDTECRISSIQEQGNRFEILIVNLMKRTITIASIIRLLSSSIGWNKTIEKKRMCVLYTCAYGEGRGINFKYREIYNLHLACDEYLKNIINFFLNIFKVRISKDQFTVFRHFKFWKGNLKKLREKFVFEKVKEISRWRRSRENSSSN